MMRSFLCNPLIFLALRRRSRWDNRGTAGAADALI
jgi:hypothetical protein